MNNQPPSSSFGSKMSSFFRSLNCCGGSAYDDDEPRAIQIVSSRPIPTIFPLILPRPNPTNLPHDQKLKN